MNAARRCAAAIRRVGGTAYLLRGESRTPFIASLQPVGSSWEEHSGVTGRGGPRRAVLYAGGEAARSIRPGDSLEWNGERYRVLDHRAVTAGGQTAYHRLSLHMESGCDREGGEPR